MDSVHERVLAYELANTVALDEWDQVVGGVSIHAPTFTLTGSIYTPDMIFDQ